MKGKSKSACLLGYLSKISKRILLVVYVYTLLRFRFLLSSVHNRKRFESIDSLGIESKLKATQNAFKLRGDYLISPRIDKIIELRTLIEKSLINVDYKITLNNSTCKEYF